MGLPCTKKLEKLPRLKEGKHSFQKDLVIAKIYIL